MHSGGAQKSGQRSQPAQSDFFWVTTGWSVRSPKHSFAAIGAARRGHSRGFQRSNLCSMVLTRALCASLVPGGARGASALAWQPFQKARGCSDHRGGARPFPAPRGAWVGGSGGEATGGVSRASWEGAGGAARGPWGARRRSQGACVGTCTPYAPGFSPSPGRSWNAGASASVAIAARAGPRGGARALLWCRARPRATRSSKEEEEKTRQTIWWAARAREARRRGPAPSGAPLAGPVGPGEGC